MYMSKSDLSPSDAAWAVLKQTNDPDKVEKLLPLIPLAVGGLMGAHGAYTGAGGKIYKEKKYSVTKGNQRVTLAKKLGYTHIEGIIV